MKNSRPLLLSRPAVIAALVLGFMLVVGTALLSAFSTRGVAAASSRIGHVQTTLLQLNQLLATLIDAETGQRGYILTGLEKYLAPYDRADERVRAQIADLRHSLADSPEQLAILDSIEKLAEAKLAEMARSVALRRDNIGAALNVIGSDVGLVTMNALRGQLESLEQHELAELNRRSGLAAERARQLQFFSLSMILVALALALTSASLLMRRMRELEDLITVCAWTNRVKYEGKWVSFEQYLQRRFHLRFTHGISEEASRKLMLEEVELLRPPPSGPATSQA
jgi:CHASE3 domain sensor protein